MFHKNDQKIFTGLFTIVHHYTFVMQSLSVLCVCCTVVPIITNPIAKKPHYERTSRTRRPASNELPCKPGILEYTIKPITVNFEYNGHLGTEKIRPLYRPLSVITENEVRPIAQPPSKYLSVIGAGISITKIQGFLFVVGDCSLYSCPLYPRFTV